MHISFKVARFHQQKIFNELPTPSAMVVGKKSITFSYSFTHRMFSGEQYMRMGLIRKSIEAVFGSENITHIYMDEPNFTEKSYHIDAFYHSYCEFKTYPKWIWCNNKADLLRNSSLYAVRLAEKDLFTYETILGYIYIQNSRLKHKKVTDFKQLVIMAWKRVEYIDRLTKEGKFDRVSPEEVSRVRSEAGKLGNAKSIEVRGSKAEVRQKKVQELISEGITDKGLIAYKLGVSERTVRSDLKKINFGNLPKPS